ncbi:18250_t:CDS:10 [Entrophospora sp. SA101]|nr:18250_t:CDS:10 [Entrophospora sp. SA101]
MAFVNANNIEQIVESNSINYIEESAGPEAIYNKRETRNAVINDDKQDQNLEKIVKQSIRKSRPRKEVDEQDPAKSFLEKWKFKDPGICCVCLEGATDVGNMLVYCDGQKCEVICHQECHGIKNLPSTDDPWYCDKCLAKPSEVVSCILCPKKTGAFRRLHEEDDFKTNSWVHLVCALWMPGMWIANTQGLNECSIISVEKTNWIKDCCICPKELASQGATVHCDAGGCKNWIHVTCAQSYNLLEYEDDSEMSDPYFVYCKEHCSQAGTVRLNEWERWILKRDKFLDNVRSEELQKRNNKLTSELIDQGKILREIFEDNYSEYQKRREKQIVKLRKNVAQLYSEYKGDKDKISRGEEQIESLEQKKRTVKSETIELANYLNRLRFRVKAFVEKMIKKDADDSNIINNNVEIKQYTECSTYKEAERQIRDGLIEKSMIEIQRLLAKLPNSISDWNNNNVEEAKTINIKKLDIEEIETLGLDNAQKILVQRQKERKQKGKKGKKTTTTATNNGKSKTPKKNLKVSRTTSTSSNNGSEAFDTPSRSCILCPKKTGAFRRLQEEEGFKTDAWVHLVCALWMPGMWIANTQGLNECSIISVEKTNWIKDCCICPKELASQGATVHCDAGGCKNWIHVTCAQSYNLLEYEDDSEMSDPYFVYCKEHCSQAGTVRLNEWERWILKRDKFLDNVRSEELQKRNNKLTSELIDQGKILREIFEDNYSEYQKRREKQIVKLRKNVAQLYSEYKGDKDKISRGEEQIESLEQKKRTVKSETIELANYLNRLRFRVKAFVEKMIKKDADDSNIINNNVEIKQYTECSTYKEAERQIRDGLIEKSMIEIQRLLAKLPNSISDWNNNNVEEAKTINIKKLDIEEIETLGLDNAQKILVQRQKERKQKGKKGKKTTTTATNNGKSKTPKKNLKVSRTTSTSSNNGSEAFDTPSRVITNIKTQLSSSTNSTSKIIDELTNQLKKAYNTGMVPFPASRKNISDLINLPENNNSTIITTTSRMSASSPSKNSKNKKKNSSEIFKDTYDYYSNKKVRNDDDEYYNSHSGNINGNKNRSKIIYGSIISGTIENTIFSGSSNHSNRNVRKRSQKKPLMRKRKKNGNSSDSSQQQYKLPSRYPQPICFKCDRIEPPDDYQPPSYVKNTKASNLMLEKKGRDTVNRMIRCNFCTKWYHLACMNPPRKTMPIGAKAKVSYS